MERRIVNRNEFVNHAANGGRIHRVLQQLRMARQPAMVSLGPYHHGKLDLQAAEEYKHKVLEMFISASGKSREFFYSAVFQMVGEIKSSYVGISTEDGALAEMMLLDVCFLINLMEISTGKVGSYNHFCHHLGMGALPFAFQDSLFLENQIPLYVVKLLLSMRHGDRAHRLLHEYVSMVLFCEKRVTIIPGEDENQPLHLLEMYHRLCIDSSITGESKESPSILREIKLKRKESGIPIFSEYSRPFRSVTRLKEKGIYFMPSSYSLNDIRFTSYPCYGVLHLPIWFVTNNSKAFFINMIAYEMSPESHVVTGLQVTSYVNFMKSLIEIPEDVKELRERNIMFSTLGSDEEIVKILKEIDTFGADNPFLFKDVKYRLTQHCHNRAKTWMAELVHTNFRSPWTAMALLAATFLLCLTFLQTYYTMNPVS